MKDTIPQSLGGFVEFIMEKRGISGNALAKGLEIAEGSVRNLLKCGVEPGTPAPKPETLRKLGLYFGIHPLFFFQLAGYLPPGGAQITPQGLMVGKRFDRLSTDKQKAVLDLLESFEQLPDSKKVGEVYLELFPRAVDLRERRDKQAANIDWYLDYEYQRFEELVVTENARRTDKNDFLRSSSRLNAHDEINAMPTRFPLVDAIRRCLAIAFDGHDQFSIEDVEQVLDHPMARAMINVLLPHRDLDFDLKLFFLVVNGQIVDDMLETILGPGGKPIPEDYASMDTLIREIWAFLVEATGL